MTDVPGRFEELERVFVGGRPFAVRSAQSQSGAVRLRLEGIVTRDDAEGLRDQLIEIPRAEVGPLPEGHYYHEQIVGLRVRTEAGQDLGTVAEVLPTGANDVYVVRGAGPEILVPAIDEVVRSIDLEAGVVTVSVMEGLIPEPRPARPERSWGRRSERPDLRPPRGGRPGDLATDPTASAGSANPTNPNSPADPTNPAGPPELPT